jgi:hypothetical protein
VVLEFELGLHLEPATPSALFCNEFF